MDMNGVQFDGFGRFRRAGAGYSADTVITIGMFLNRLVSEIEVTFFLRITRIFRSAVALASLRRVISTRAHDAILS